jgi:hypothetical protein
LEAASAIDLKGARVGEGVCASATMALIKTPTTAKKSMLSFLILFSSPEVKASDWVSFRSDRSKNEFV